MTRLRDLDAYVTGELDDAAAEAFEEAMFDTPEDADVAFVDRVARHGRQLAAHGTFETGVSRAHIDALIAAGHTVQVLDAGPASTEPRHFVVSRDAELVVTKLDLGRPDLAVVDVEIELVDHQVTKTIKDVAVDRSDGTIWGLCERPLAQLAYGAGRAITRVRHRDGDRAVIAEWHLVGRVEA